MYCAINSEDKEQLYVNQLLYNLIIIKMIWQAWTRDIYTCDRLS